MVSVALSGPPPVNTYILSKTLKVSMVRSKSTNIRAGRNSGNVMYLKV